MGTALGVCDGLHTYEINDRECQDYQRQAGYQNKPYPSRNHPLARLDRRQSLHMVNVIYLHVGCVLLRVRSSERDGGGAVPGCSLGPNRGRPSRLDKTYEGSLAAVADDS